jgi:hypothetical protein
MFPSFLKLGGANYRSRSLVLGIDFDPMAAQERLGLLAIGIGNNQIRRLHGHMTVDAACDYFFAEFWKNSASFRPVALEAASGKVGSVTLDLMNVVAGSAGHVSRFLETAA